MGIKSTATISRETAIRRISEINRLVATKDYLQLETVTSEYDHNIREFVDQGVEDVDVSKWTNKMLEEVMDAPFYRFSMFDNYFVCDENEE